MYAYFGIQYLDLVGKIAVLDTGPGTNFYQVLKVLDEVFMRKIGVEPNISDKNGNLMEMSGTASLLLFFGTYVVKTDFYVCKRLAAQ